MATTVITGWDDIDVWLRNVGQMLHVLREEFAITRAYLEGISEVRLTLYGEEEDPNIQSRAFYWSVCYGGHWRPLRGSTVYVALTNLLSTDAQHMTDAARAAIFSCIGELKEL